MSYSIPVLVSRTLQTLLNSDETRMRVHESCHAQRWLIAVLNAFPTLSCILFKVTGHPFWRFVENRYFALKIRPIFIKFSPNVRQCM